MAKAVGVDVSEALAAAGFNLDPEQLAMVLADIKGHNRDVLPMPDFDLVAELERVRRLPIPAQARLDLIRAIVDLHEQARDEAAGDVGVRTRPR